MRPPTRDPLRTVRDALERHECGPTGPDHRYVARCPGHEDRSPSLSVGEGVDGRALLHCFAGCTAADIVAALGLHMQDLFADDRRRSSLPAKFLAKPREPIDLILDAFREIGAEYRCTANPDMWVTGHCPACGWRDRVVVLIVRENKRVRLCCFQGCDPIDVLVDLLGVRETS
jgi:hypothetical protein